MRVHNTILLVLLALLLSCQSAPRYSDNDIALKGEGDESGIGGTGKPANGVGRTGKQLANGVGGTGKQLADGVGGTGKQLANGVGGTGKQLANGVGGTGKQLADGVGGTGKQLADGVGGTGQIAKSGLGGTGIVGEITGFGSIYVNGLEIEILTESEIRINNRINRNGNAEIGDIVEILAHRNNDDIFAKKLNIRYEVIGPVESLNLKNHSFTIIGQTVKLDQATMKLPHLGDMIAVSGFRDQLNIIHASRLSYSNSNTVWLIDEISAIKTNLIEFKNTSIQTEYASYYKRGETIRVRAKFKNGQLYATDIYANAAFGNQLQHMVLQGFILKGNRNNYKIGDVQFSSRQVRIRSQLDRNQGRWTRIEVRRNRIGLWQVDNIIDDRLIERGSLTSYQPQMRIPTNRRANSSSNQTQDSTARPVAPASNPSTGIPTPQNPGMPSNPMPGMPEGGLMPNPGNTIPTPGTGMPIPRMPEGGGMPSIPGMPEAAMPTPGMPTGGTPNLPGMPGGGMPTNPARPETGTSNPSMPNTPSMPGAGGMPNMPGRGGMGNPSIPGDQNSPNSNNEQNSTENGGARMGGRMGSGM